MKEHESVASKADLQRQRRNQKLEETKRLLDGHVLNNLHTTTMEYEAVENHDHCISRSHTRSVEQDEVPVNDSSERRAYDARTNGVISKEQFVRIQSKHENFSDEEMGGHSTSTCQSEEENYAVKYATLITERNSVENLDSVRTLSERPVEGRGRGRGRGRSTTADNHSSSLGEMSQSSRSVYKSTDKQNHHRSYRLEHGSTSHIVKSYFR